MNTQFSLLGKTLNLSRYPAQLQHPSWQAWDAADEYIIETVTQTLGELDTQGVRIYNDDFGALGCWFADLHPDWIQDSHVAHLALGQNLAANDIDSTRVNECDSLAPLTRTATLVLMKIPKTTALLEQQLIDLQPSVTPQTRIIAGGKANLIQKSTLALFEKYLGPTHTSLAKKKSRLIFCQPTAEKHNTSPYPTIWYTEHPRLKISNHANVFGRQQLDIGARLLLANLPDCNGKTVLDLGCGNGVLGLHVLAAYPDSRVIFVDESYMAVASARDNVTDNFPRRLDDCHFLVSNCLEQFDQLEDAPRPDIVLCNPPFHQQNAITDHIAFQMFKDARFRLNRGGELRIIGNRHLDYPQKLKRLFGGYKVVASDRKFSILSATNR